MGWERWRLRQLLLQPWVTRGRQDRVGRETGLRVPVGP